MTPSLLPIKRPWWVLVTAAMLVSGFKVEEAKINLNDYLGTLEAHPEWEAAGACTRFANPWGVRGDFVAKRDARFGLKARPKAAAPQPPSK